MTTNTIRSLATILALTAAVPAQKDPKPSQLAELGAKARAITQAHVASVVTIHVVVKIEFAGQSREQRLESRGTLVTETGLVMTDDGVVSPHVNVQANGRTINDVKTEVQDIKVVFGNEEDEQASFLVGKDSKLGLAFLQVRSFDAKKRSIPVLDYGKAADAEIGDIVVTPNRLEKGFDFAPFFAFGWITGDIRKPLKCSLLSSGTNTGLASFNLAGKLVGAHTQIRPSVGGGNPRPVLLAGGVVNGAIQQAQKRAQTMSEEQKGEADASAGKDDADDKDRKDGKDAKDRKDRKDRK